MKRIGVGDKKRGQIWVETVIYTLIGLAIIGIVLGVSKPKIDEKRDEISITGAIESLRIINLKINEVTRAQGNKRTIDLEIGKGNLIVDLESDKITWVIDSKYQYSEEEIPIDLGKIQVTTFKDSPYRVELESNFDYDLVSGSLTEGVVEFNSASIPYKLVIENVGSSSGRIGISISSV